MKTAVIAFAAMLAATLVLGVGCGDGDSVDDERTIDVGELTFEDVQERARGAVDRPGQVYHARRIATHVDDDTEDVWLILERNIARREAVNGQSIDLQYEGGFAAIVRERVYDEPCNPCDDRAAEDLVAHLNWLLDETTRDRSISAGVVGGEPTIRVKVTREYGGDYTGDVTATIDLDESFLPVRLQIDPPGSLPDAEYEYESEFVSRDSLAANFFSKESLIALAPGGLAGAGGGN